MMLRVLLIVIAALGALFVLSLVVYFLNLDMKLAAAMIPIMNKIYDRGRARRARKAEKKDGSV